MNKVILKGRTTKLPEIRYSSTDEPQCYARLTLAVEDRNWKEGEKFHVDYISCYTMGKLAELIEKSVGKGQELLLSGKWRTFSYEKDGKLFTHRVCSFRKCNTVVKKQTVLLLMRIPL